LKRTPSRHARCPPDVQSPVASDLTKFEDEKTQLIASENAKYVGEKVAMEVEHRLALERLQKSLQEQKTTAKNRAWKPELGLRMKIAEITQADID